ncbi:membrane protein [Bacteriovorax sp. Seq25_V]|uniref:membrane protein n=1 Tax=Bacteriovorax sp. Seq25_V TaxID=1201288 RepID=UPI00038A1265|nr:membrane protein [Bacteriovorax sp. Seq25_V]EQC47103.1 putative membrane protein [Bacteriovorax sp. Seq25_V]
MIFSTIKNIHQEFVNIDKKDRRNILAVAFNLFLVLFSYPMIRSASTAIFLEKFGAKNTPLVWILSVIALSLSVTLFNRFQKKKDVFFLYNFVVFVTVIFFLICNGLYYLDFSYSSYFYYVWKEVYIILLVHLSLGYLNASVEYKVAKLTYGPLGALGSLGGVLGGIATNKFIPWMNAINGGHGVFFVGLLGVTVVALTHFVFRSTGESVHLKQDQKKELSPLRSVRDVKSYVFLVASIVAISQFVINLANYKFNLGIEGSVNGLEEKATFLGNVYSNINLISFLFQIFLIPIILKFIKVKWVHFFIPFIYILIFFTTLGPVGGFIPVTILFVTYKGLDYSLFSTAKEMLYFPLLDVQKYGAKYIVDMIVYRASKMVISAVLLIYNTAFFVDCTLGICLIVWIILTAFLFTKKHDR